MNQNERISLLKQLMWDYNISPDSVDKVLSGEEKYAGHYDRQKLFIKTLESFPWFTVLKIFTLEEVRELLTPLVISKLRSRDLQQKYEFLRKKLQITQNKVIYTQGLSDSKNQLSSTVSIDVSTDG